MVAGAAIPSKQIRTAIIAAPLGPSFMASIEILLFGVFLLSGRSTRQEVDIFIVIEADRADQGEASSRTSKRRHALHPHGLHEVFDGSIYIPQFGLIQCATKQTKHLWNGADLKRRF